MRKGCVRWWLVWLMLFVCVWFGGVVSGVCVVGFC